MQVFKSPQLYPKDGIKIFLAGSIDMGKAEDWQSEFTKKVEDTNLIILNPRRDDWNCVDETVQCVTSNGIKSHDEITNDDLLLTYNIKLDKLEYIKPKRIHKYNVVDADMLQFKRNNDMLLFTPNHNMISRKSSKLNSYGIYPASNFLNKANTCRSPSGKELHASNTPIHLFDTQFTDSHFKLYAWLLSEGSIFIKKDTSQYTIVIAQYIKNASKVNKIKELLDELNISYRYDDRQFYLDSDAVNFIKGYLNFEKYTIPLWIKHASPTQKRIFITEYALGDGCVINNNIAYIAFSKKYESYAKEFQILCYEAGISSKWNEKTSGFGHPVINIKLHNFDKLSYTFKYNKTIKYSGVIWCPETENNTWVAYKNGSMFITGNSTWIQSYENIQFKEQVEWELAALTDADIIVMYFDPNGQSPISLLELGLFHKRPIVVCCPDGYWKQGNVEVVCKWFGVEFTKDKELFFNRIIELCKTL